MKYETSFILFAHIYFELFANIDSTHFDFDLAFKSKAYESNTKTSVVLRDQDWAIISLVRKLTLKRVESRSKIAKGFWFICKVISLKIRDESDISPSLLFQF